MKDHPCCRFRFLIPLAILAFAALASFAVCGLWNGVVTVVFGLKAITYSQAVGLLLLCKLLFGGFPRRGGSCGPGWRGRMMKRHWESLDPEQREKMREEMRRRFGDWPRPCCGDEDEPGEAAAGPKGA